MDCLNFSRVATRREFLARFGFGVGAMALSHLCARAAVPFGSAHAPPRLPHFAPRVKRVIFLFQSGGPSHLDLFDYKPLLHDFFDKDIPDSVRQGQRLTGMVSGQSRLPVQPTRYAFAPAGRSGLPISELLPYTRHIADDICVIRSMHTEAVNHDPAITFLQTGSQLPGRPSMGAWIDYGLGSLNENLPAFVVLNSVPREGPPDQGLLARLWGAGFLPTRHQGVQLRGTGDPVLYLSDPPGISSGRRRMMLDTLKELNHQHFTQAGDPETETRIAQYEMAFRMQSSVPELTDLSDEPEHVFELYGDEARKPGTYARHCLMARRLAERGVRFTQLYHRGWDHHSALTKRLPVLAGDVDRASAALVTDLKQRGMLEDTLVVWGGEFGRTTYAQGGASYENYGRDHHGRAFSIWMAGGGIKGGTVYGETDDFGFNIVDKPVHIHDLQATILYALGLDHERLTHRFQGRQFRLTDVHGHVVHDLFS
jgi:hypothetical protein